MAAAEIEGLGLARAALVDAMLLERLEALGGAQSVNRYHDATKGAYAWQARAWLLGEVETLAELQECNASEAQVLAWDCVAEVREAHEADLTGLRTKFAGVVDEVARLRERLTAAGQQVLDLVAAKSSARARAEAAEAEAAWAREALAAVRADRDRLLAERDRGRCVDALNTEVGP